MTTVNIFESDNSNVGPTACSYIANEPDSEELYKKIKETQKKQTGLQSMAEAITRVKKESREDRILGAILIRKVLSVAENPPIDIIVQSGILPHLLNLYRTGEAYLKYEIGWIFTNIASGNSKTVQYILHFGVIQAFAEDLNQSNNFFVLENIIWCCGNIAGDSPEHRDMLIDHDILAGMVNFYHKFHTTYPPKKMEDFIWSLGNFVRGKPAPQKNKIMDCVPIFIEQFKRAYSLKKVDFIKDCAWGLSYISDKFDLSMIHNAELIPIILELLSHSNFQIIIVA